MTTEERASWAGVLWTATKAGLAVVLSMFFSLPFTIRALVVLLILDFVTGYWASAKENNTDSRVAWHGAKKKAAMVMIVLAGYWLARESGANHFTVNTPFGELGLNEALNVYFCGREATSTLENYVRMGGDLPEWLKSRLAQLK